MNKDFRIAVSLPTHPKTKKLMRKLGDRAFYSLINLWSFVAMNKPDGILVNMDEEDIEIAADWIGQYSKFVLALIELKFINKIDGVYIIHDWEEHNGYAFHAKERSEKAKKAANMKWEKHNKNKELMLQASLSSATSNPELCPSPDPSPDPDPDPDPNPSKKKNVKTFLSDSIEYRLANLLYTEILKNNPNHKKPDLHKWAKHIDRMIRLDKRTPDDIKKMIFWIQNNNFWRKNVLSTDKLREKFDRLTMAILEPDKPKKVFPSYKNCI